MNTENKKSSMIAGAVMTSFMTLLALWGLSNHEPWFDEAQAWMIAKSSSWSEILFSIPHYEAHPPLWHILLKLVSYTGLSFAAAVKLVQFITFEAALLLLEFRSPFRPLMKILLPLGYYFSYQYAVVSRPYALLMTAVFLSAVCHKKRREKTFPYMLSLLFMCLCHSYGIALAGGLVIADIAGDILAEKSLFKAFGKIITDKKRLVSYFILLIAAICLVIEIMPAKDAFAVERTGGSLLNYLKNLLLAWLLIPAENILTLESDYELIQCQNFGIGTLIKTAVISVAVWIFLFAVTRKRKTVLTAFIPYILLSLLFARYAYPYHFGVFYIFLIFVLWICEEEKPLGTADLKLFKIKEEYRKITEKAVAVILGVPVLVNISWSIHSFSADRKYSYEPTNELFEWIEKNGYRDGYTWFAGFDEEDTNSNSGSAIVLNAYCGENIFYNMDRDKPYFTHISADEDEISADIAEMKNHNSPDFILAYGSGIGENCEAVGIDDEYELVFRRSGNPVVKSLDTEVVVSVYAKKGIVKHKSNEFGF